MTRIKATHPLGNGATLSVDYDVDATWFVVGGWLIEVASGKLIVRSQYGDVNVLQVDADRAS